MLGRIKFSTALYLIALILLVGWLAKSYLDLDAIKTKLSSLSKEVEQIDESALDKLKEDKERKYRSTADGIFFDPADVDQAYPVAIVLDNVLEARPQAGLDKASIVFEAAAEGGITRFLAIFTWLDNIERIGAIRSARPYFLDWSEEFGKPIFLHVGGSADALNGINRRALINLDEFYWRDSYYSRVADREAPHNVFTTPALLKKIKENYLLNTSKYDSWQFKDDAEQEERGEISIQKIDFSKANYDYEADYLVAWKYDKIANDYVRWQGDYVHKAENGAAIRAKNIAVVYTKQQIIDDVGRLKIKTIGKGKAQIFQDGKVIEGQWRKDDAVSRIKFYNNNNEEVELNAGQTWIEVVPIGNEVIFNNLENI
jgi:hypothetical protein